MCVCVDGVLKVRTHTAATALGKHTIMFTLGDALTVQPRYSSDYFNQYPNRGGSRGRSPRCISPGCSFRLLGDGSGAEMMERKNIALSSLVITLDYLHQMDFLFAWSVVGMIHRSQTRCPSFNSARAIQIPITVSHAG